MIITINSADLTNVLQNTSIVDRTYKLQMLNEFTRKGELNIRYTFLVKPVDGEFFPLYPMLNFYASDNSKNQDINSVGVLSIAQPNVTPQFTIPVFSTYTDFDPDLVYYYPFSNGNNLLGPTPRADLVPSGNASFQYVAGPFAGVSAINSTAGFFQPPMKLQVSNLEENWGFSCWIKGSLTVNSLFMQLRRQDERGFTNVNFQTPWPRIDVFFTPQGQLRLRCVDINEQLVIGWTSNSQISNGNNWGHLVISFSDSGQAVYINGVLDTGVYTVGNSSTIYNFSANLLPFELSEYRMMQTNNVQYALPTIFSDTITAGEAADMYTNIFPYTTSGKVAFHYPLNNSLQPTAGYTLQDFTNGGLTYSSSVSKPIDSNGSASLQSSGISVLPPNFQQIRGLDEYSFSFWIRPTSNPQWLYRLNDLLISLAINAGGNIVLRLRNSSNNTIVAVTSTGSYLNQWFHLAVSLSTTQGNRFYINGLQETVYGTGTQNINFMNSNIIDGGLFNRISFNGSSNISDYAVWNKFLTQEDAQAMYEGNFDYKISYSIPTGTTQVLGGHIIHKTPCHKTQTIQLRRPSDRVRVRLGSTQAVNPAQIENYILTLYINE